MDPVIIGLLAFAFLVLLTEANLTEAVVLVVMVWLVLVIVGGGVDINDQEEVKQEVQTAVDNARRDLTQAVDDARNHIKEDFQPQETLQNVNSVSFGWLADGRITSKFRTAEEVVAVGVDQETATGRACFVKDTTVCEGVVYRKHESVVFACLPDKIYCYPVRNVR